MKASPTAIVIGASLLIVSATAAYVAEGFFARFDRAIAMIEQVPATIASVDASTREIRAVMDEFEKKMAKARAAMPAVGEEIGQSGAVMVETLKRRLDLTDAPREMAEPPQDRGSMDSSRQEADAADAIERRIGCWKAKREIGKSGEPIGMWCGYENLADKEPETEEELRQALANPDLKPRRTHRQDARDALERLGIRERNSKDADEGKGGTLVSDLRKLLEEHRIADAAKGNGTK